MITKIELSVEFNSEEIDYLKGKNPEEVKGMLLGEIREYLETDMELKVRSIEVWHYEE